MRTSITPVADVTDYRTTCPAFTLLNIAGRIARLKSRREAYYTPYNAGLISKVSEEIVTENALNIVFFRLYRIVSVTNEILVIFVDNFVAYSHFFSLLVLILTNDNVD